MNVLIRDIERILGVVNDSFDDEGAQAEATMASVYFEGATATLVVGRRETMPIVQSPYHPPPGVPAFDPLPDCPAAPLPDCPAAPPAVTDDLDFPF